MKKLIPLICILLLITSLSGCMFLLGGVNERTLGEFAPVYTDGESDYFQYIQYSSVFDYGLVTKNREGYLLTELSTNDEALKLKDKNPRLVYRSCVTALSDGWDVCVEGFEYIQDALDEMFDAFDKEVFSETVILENQGVIYGAVNFYSRPSGSSGSLLTNENIIKGSFVNITEGKVKVIKELEDTAILAFNRSHLITYKDKNIYSVNLSDGENTFLFKDKWWDKGPTYYNDFDVSFTDESFAVYAQLHNGMEVKETLVTGNIDGACLTFLIDNKKVEF